MPRVGTLRWGLSAMRVSVECTLRGPARGPPDYETSGCACGFFLVSGADSTTPTQCVLLTFRLSVGKWCRMESYSAD